MKCIKCGSDLNRSDYECPVCKSSISLMKKLTFISNRYYNKGLEQAKASDLSNACDSLRMAVGFNKRNINARNLLGLVLFEIGEVAEAYKNWILSASYKKSGNPAIDYLKYVDENIVELDKMDMGIKMYNEALSILKAVPLYTDEPDKIRRRLENALGKLKGATDFNPKLLKAVNLTTLCYIILGERSKALELSKAVLYEDIANPRATLYFNILCPDRTRPPVKVTGNIEKKAKPTDVQATPVEKQGIFSSAMFMEAAAFLLGIIACMAVFFFLLRPGMFEEKDARIAELENSLKVYEELSPVTEISSDETGQGSVSEEISGKEAAIAKAKQLYDGYYYIDACALIFDMDTSDVSEQSKAVYSSIIDDVTLKGAEALCDLGIKSYNEGKTDEAVEFLNKALTYSEAADEENKALSEVKYTASFYLGRTAADSGDTTEAARLFSEVRDKHPDKKYQDYAKSYLKSLTEE